MYISCESSRITFVSLHTSIGSSASLVSWKTSAPNNKRRLTVCINPQAEAVWSGENPFSSWALTSAPLQRRIFMASKLLPRTLWWSGVSPMWFVWLMLMLWACEWSTRARSSISPSWMAAMRSDSAEKLILRRPSWIFDTLLLDNGVEKDDDVGGE